jgi:putative ABC transport system ATP-binding protein
MLPRLLDNRKPDEGKLQAILETIGLSGRKNHLPNELSGGQQQRASVGRALINDPALILADEPTGNLDERAGHMVGELLSRLRRELTMTLVVVTHNRDLAARMDRCLELRSGALYEKTPG